LTQEQLAEVAGFFVDMLSNIEHGVNALSMAVKLRSDRAESSGW
jgi:transcriptional regulator with XRE-family HTH domain